MKTTIDIPDGDLEDIMKFTGSKTKREAVVRAIQEYNRRCRLTRLADEVLGSFEDFMTRADLDEMRTGS